MQRLRGDPISNEQLQSRVDADRFLNYIGFNFETENLDTMYKVILMSSWPPEVIHEFIVEGNDDAADITPRRFLVTSALVRSRKRLLQTCVAPRARL